MLKISVPFKKFTNFTDKQFKNFESSEYVIFRVLFLYEHKRIERL